jgi:hypothetical protein
MHQLNKHHKKSFPFFSPLSSLQRQLLSLSPGNGENGDAAVRTVLSPACVPIRWRFPCSRRFFARKIFYSAPCSRVPAAHFGDNVANKKRNEYPVFHPA